MTDSTLARNPNARVPRVACQRDGVTLVELLVVMAVVVLLAGLTLPTVKTLLKDQRTSQSARVVHGFIESARARAIASGRPVAVIFERLGNTDAVTRKTCVQMSIGEVFPPYEGDWAGTMGTLIDSDSNGYADAIDIPMAQAATLTSIVSDGDFLEIGTQRLGFSVNGKPGTSPLDPTDVRVKFWNPYQYTDSTKTPPVVVSLDEKRLPVMGGAPEVRFRIYRKPSKTMTGTVVLPRGTCIDLGWSGMGPTGTTFGSTSNTSATRLSIYVVFNAAGAVDSIFEFQETASGTLIDPPPAFLGLIHFLVGRTDQVDLPPARASDRDDVKANIVDTANNWVSINSFTGRVYSSDVAATAEGTTADVAGARFFATQGVNKKGM